MKHSRKVTLPLLLITICLALFPKVQAAVWVSPSGQASWQNAQSPTPLNGAACCSLAVANANASAGDTVYLRAGAYVNQKIQPSKSGASEGNRIVFTSYNGEKVVISKSPDGIRLYKRSYITVNGITFDSLQRFMRLYASHYGTISNCTFDHCYPAGSEWVGALIANDPYDTTASSEPSTYNRVDHCTFYRWVYGAFDGHRGCLLDIGSSDTGVEDKSYYNLVENSTFAYGGHHTLAAYSKYNVIRNNYFHNETNPANWAFEGYRATLTEGPYAGWCLWENNRFGLAGASGLALRSKNNIIRRNTWYRNGNGSIQVVANVAGVDHADSNHMYSNTFFHNGYDVAYVNFQGAIYFSSWSGQSPVGNVIKNNIFFRNSNGAIHYDGKVDSQVIGNNWDRNNMDPGLCDTSGTDPDNPLLPDLRLKSTSAAIDSGTYLTRITSASRTGTSFRVEDAKYFTDGWGISGVAGDKIQLFGTDQKARIIAVDYLTNTITVDAALTWTQNQGVCLEYQGRAPDLGAHEYGTASINAPKIMPPAKACVVSGPLTVYTLRGQVVGEIKGMHAYGAVRPALPPGIYFMRTSANVKYRYVKYAVVR